MATKRFTGRPTIEPAKQARDVVCVDVHYRIPRSAEDPSTVTFVYEYLDDDGKLIARKPVTLNLDDNPELLADISARLYTHEPSGAVGTVS